MSNNTRISMNNVRQAISNGDTEWLINQFNTNKKQLLENWPTDVSNEAIEALANEIFEFYKRVGFDGFRHLGGKMDWYEENVALNIVKIRESQCGNANSKTAIIKISSDMVFGKRPLDVRTVDQVGNLFETIPHEMAHIVHFGLSCIPNAELDTLKGEGLALHNSSWGKPNWRSGRSRFLAHGKVWKMIYGKMTGWRIKKRFFNAIETQSEREGK